MKRLYTNCTASQYNVQHCLRILLPVKKGSPHYAPVFLGREELLKQLRTLDRTWGHSEVLYNDNRERYGEMLVFFSNTEDELYIKMLIKENTNRVNIWRRNTRFTVYEFTNEDSLNEQ